jgi:hypothetical protein
VTANSMRESAPAPLDFITIAQAPRCVLTKRVDRRKSIEQMFTPYGDAYWFNLQQLPVSRLEDIGDLLAGSLIGNYTLCAVYGAIADPARVNQVRKLSRRDAATGYEATLQPCAHWWAPIDSEDVDLPADVAAADLHACAQLAIAALPPAFHGVRCITQATSGHGLKPQIRMRLWHWFTRPVTGPELSFWLRDCLKDHSTFTPSQPIYTARPIFLDGWADHIQHRLAWINPDGPAAVEVPPAEMLKPPPRPPAPPRPRRIAAPDETDVEAFVADSLARLEAAEPGHRHRTRFFEARLLGGIAEESDIDDEMMVEWLLEIHPPPDAHYYDEERTIREGILSGRAEPIDIPSRRKVSLLRGGVIDDEICWVPPPQKDNRADETRWQIFSMLRKGVPGERLLSEVHAYNESRETPLDRGRVNEIIAWAVGRHMETKNG